MNKESLIEAILFTYGEPVSFAQISKLTGMKEEEIKTTVDSLKDNLRADNRGLDLISHNGKVQLITKPVHAPVMEKLLKSELTDDLTPASEETLAIVGYLGPVGKSKIDYLRGVNSAYTLRNLSLRGLVEKSADPKRPASHLYSLSFDLLRHLGITKTENLPEYEKYNSLGSEDLGKIS